MRVLILGFSSLQEIDSVMEKLIESTQCFLFTVVCGGTDNVAYDWAQKAGVPVTFSQVKTPARITKRSRLFGDEARSFITAMDEKFDDDMEKGRKAWYSYSLKKDTIL